MTFETQPRLSITAIEINGSLQNDKLYHGAQITSNLSFKQIEFKILFSFLSHVSVIPHKKVNWDTCQTTPRSTFTHREGGDDSDAHWPHSLVKYQQLIISNRLSEEDLKGRLFIIFEN